MEDQATADPLIPKSAQTTSPAKAWSGPGLCERCGYLLGEAVAEPVRTGGQCPECGLAISESAPMRRVGSDFQRSPSIRSWLSTLKAVLIEPKRLMSQLRAEPDADRQLLAWNCVPAGVVLALVVLLNLRLPPSAVEPLPLIVLLMLALFRKTRPIVGLPFIALSVIEAAGVRYFGGRRGWRIERSTARAICAHASFAWVLAPIGLSIGLYVTQRAVGLFERAVSQSVQAWLPPMDWVMPFAGFAAGMMVFESLVALGASRCKFANMPFPAGKTLAGASRSSDPR